MPSSCPGGYDRLVMKPPGWARPAAVAGLAAATLFAVSCGGSPPASPYTPGPPPPTGHAGPAWHPAPGTTWQWQLNGTVDPSVDAQVYDIDVDNSSQVVAALHARG